MVCHALCIWRAKAAPALGAPVSAGVRGASVSGVRKILEWAKQKDGPTMDTVMLTETGFAVGDAAMDWTAIKRISAFKFDAVTMDDVYFEIQKDGQFIRLWGEQAGFQSFVIELESRFPDIAGWRQRILSPPFAENFTVLYVRN